MKIETKFDINNLVVHKFQRNPLETKSKTDLLCCFEVIDINTGTCMAGTQIFYDVRVIHGIKSTEYVDGEKKITWKDFSASSNSKGEYIRMREDELVAAPKELVDLILGNS